MHLAFALPWQLSAAYAAKRSMTPKRRMSAELKSPLQVNSLRFFVSAAAWLNSYPANICFLKNSIHAICSERIIKKSGEQWHTAPPARCPTQILRCRCIPIKIKITACTATNPNTIDTHHCEDFSTTSAGSSPSGGMICVVTDTS